MFLKKIYVFLFFISLLTIACESMHSHTLKINIDNSIQEKPRDEFRDYERNVPEHVKELYRLNHMNQTLGFVLSKKAEYSLLNKKRMSIWQAMEVLDTIIDESDPDLDLPQSYHAFQTAEALRKDGQPRWLILVGLIHDLGKILTLFGEPQWAVVGDTFPVGCKYSEKIIFYPFFTDNPDWVVPEFQTKYGIYSPNCGLNNVHMSWGHDEYLYYVIKDYVPKEVSYIIRYHSFYAAHKEGAYEYLMNEHDKKMMPWLHLFSKYDLYSKNSTPLNIQELMPYYKELIAEYLPTTLSW